MRSCLWCVLLSVTVATTGAAQSSPGMPKSSASGQSAMSRRQAGKLRRRIDYIPADNLVGVLRGHAKVLGTTLETSGDQQTNYQLIRRLESGQPEVHARWDDLMIIRSGVGALITGDSLVGSTYRAPGERRGGTITRQYKILIRAGDVIRVPADVPHALVVSGNVPLEYLLIKQRRQKLPIRWSGGR